MLIICDFDGTITVRDCLNLIVQEFAPEAWQTIEPRLRAREIGLLEAIVEEFHHVRVTEREAVEFVMAHTRIREGFPEFVAWSERGGHEIAIVSAGFRVLIDPLLAAAGLSHVRVWAGDAHFTTEGTDIWYPPSLRDCASRCGLCKEDVVAALLATSSHPRPLVHVGDGLSDLCAARRADIVFARGSLSRLLERESIPFHPFEDFHEVRRVLEAACGAREGVRRAT